MERTLRNAILIELADRLRKRESWCGETHLQKAAFVLQEVLHVDLGLNFVVYKHGPFAFDLRDELSAMRADSLLSIEPQPQPYGPRLAPGTNAGSFRSRFERGLKKVAPEIEFVASELGSSRVNQLEKIATALFVVLHSPRGQKETWAEEIVRLKPRIDLSTAYKAIADAESLQAKALQVAHT